LLYSARLYEKLTADRRTFGGKRIRIPRPEFIILYNGVDAYPDEGLVRLSDAYEDASILGIGKDIPVALELVGKVYNINQGHNEERLRQSRTLKGYSAFTGKVREYAGTVSGGRVPLRLTDEELTGAIKEAIGWCIRHNILKEFFERNGSEVMNMLFAEFNLEAELAAEREAGWEAGQEIGWKAGREEQNRAIARNALAEGASPEFVQKITGLDLETLMRLSSP
jgi:hypothetical protein